MGERAEGMVRGCQSAVALARTVDVTGEGSDVLLPRVAVMATAAFVVHEELGAVGSLQLLRVLFLERAGFARAHARMADLPDRFHH